MRKIFVILMVIIMCLTLSACSEKEKEVVDVKQEEPITDVGNNVVNPIKEYSSLEEINEACGVNLVKPPVMGVGEETFVTINDLAQYSFKVNSNSFTFRACRQYDDISGVYVGEGTAFNETDNASAYYVNDEYKIARFFYNDVQYCLMTNDNGSMELDYFKNVVDEIKNVITQFDLSADVASLIGEYADSNSNRAGLSIDAYSANEVTMEVIWSSGASEYDKWNIIGQVNEGKIEYSEINHYSFTEDTYIVVNDGISGYFSINDGKIYWDGSGIENTSACVFER